MHLLLVTFTYDFSLCCAAYCMLPVTSTTFLHLLSSNSLSSLLCVHNLAPDAESRCAYSHVNRTCCGIFRAIRSPVEALVLSRKCDVGRAPAGPARAVTCMASWS